MATLEARRSVRTRTVIGACLASFTLLFAGPAAGALAEPSDPSSDSADGGDESTESSQTSDPVSDFTSAISDAVAAHRDSISTALGGFQSAIEAGDIAEIAKAAVNIRTANEALQSAVEDLVSPSDEWLLEE